MQRTGLLLNADDLEIGQQVAMHHSSDWSPFLGESLQITAINLPFVVGRLLGHPEATPVTVDVRECGLMPVTAEFVAAQQWRPVPTTG